MSRVLKYYRGWPDPEVGSRWESWVKAIEEDDRVRNTLADDTFYRDRYEALAQNRLESSSTSELKMVVGRAWQSNPVSNPGY